MKRDHLNDFLDEGTTFLALTAFLYDGNLR